MLITGAPERIYHTLSFGIGGWPIIVDAPQFAAVSLTARDPSSYARATVPTFTAEAAWRLRHEVSPVPD
jgi:hypothetical protein